MGLTSTLSFILQHPLSQGHRTANLFRFVSWQVRSRLASGPLLEDFVGDAKLLAVRGQAGASGNIYVGLHEFWEMAFVLHALRPGDLFVDAGANIGSYTVLAGAVVGAECLALEPAPEAFEWLNRNVDVNDVGGRVRALNVALGAREGTLEFTCDLDTMNRVAMPTDHGASACIEVPVTTLDGVLAGRCPTVVKIDVEGFEGEVVDGAERTLADPRLHSVLMELNGSGVRYGVADDAIVERMAAYGFGLCRYLPFERRLERLADRDTRSDNTLFVKDIEEVGRRVESAPRLLIRGRLL